MLLQNIPKRVLVVDDDPMSRDLLVLLLEGEGYAADSADSGESALDLIRSSESVPNLVLADVQLPGISGAQLARKLRRACGRKTILLAMSGSQPPAKAISLFNGFLLKPFTMQQVAAAWHASENQPKIPLPASTAKRKTRTTRTTRTTPTLVPIQASTVKTASKQSMDAQMQVQEMQSSDPPVGKTGAGPVLNETIYQQLAVSMPAQQLQEMYTMCVNDARRRIAGMRKLAADHDDARFMREAHAIKGGCGMLGATELHRMAAELEVNGPDAAAPGGAQNVNSLDELSAACDRLERMLGSRV